VRHTRIHIHNTRVRRHGMSHTHTQCHMYDTPASSRLHVCIHPIHTNLLNTHLNMYAYTQRTQTYLIHTDTCVSVLYVYSISNTKEPYKRDDILQNKPIILRSRIICVFYIEYTYNYTWIESMCNYMCILYRIYI